MNLIVFRLLFFCLIPAGIFILIRTIRILKDVFSGKLIAEIPFTKKEYLFDITDSGIYAIWQKGQLFRRTPIDKFKLKLSKIPTDESVSLPRSFFSPYLNGVNTGRMEMNRFKAEGGSYRLTIEEGTNASVFEKIVFSLFPAKPVDYNKYFIQIRKSRPIYYMIAAIPLLTIAAFCMIGGLIAGFMAPNILTEMGIHFAV